MKICFTMLQPWSAFFTNNISGEPARTRPYYLPPYYTYSYYYYCYYYYFQINFLRNELVNKVEIKVTILSAPDTRQLSYQTKWELVILCNDRVQSFQSAVHIHEFHVIYIFKQKFKYKYYRFKFLVSAFICSSLVLF